LKGWKQAFDFVWWQRGQQSISTVIESSRNSHALSPLSLALAPREGRRFCK